MLETILPWLFSKHWMLSWPAFTFLVLAVSPFGRIWKNPADRKRWAGYLYQGGFQRNYRRFMVNILDRLDARMSRDETIRGLGAERIAWSHGLLQIVMLLAVAYPVLSATMQWLAGAPITFGQREMIAAGPPQARAFGAILLLALSLLFLLAFRFRSWRQATLLIATATIWLGWLLGGRFDVPDAVVGAFAFAVAFAIAVAGAFVGVIIGTVVLAFALAGAFAGPFAFALALAGAFAVDWCDRRYGAHPRHFVALVMANLAALTGLVILAGQDLTPENPLNVYVLVILGILPLFNILADFASIGLTRHLMRRGLQGFPWWPSILDILGGAAIFFCLGWAIITWLHLVHPPGGAPLVDLKGLFVRLRDVPSQNYWLAFMLLTTLIPTVLHAMVGLLTCLVAYPRPLRIWIATKLANGASSDTDGWLGSLAICAMMTAAFWGPILLGALILRFDHGLVLQFVIGMFEGYARLIGAV